MATTKRKRKTATSVLEELRSLPTDTHFRDWFALLTPGQQRELNDIRSAFAKGELLGLTAKTIWERCRERLEIRVSYDRFLVWLKK